MGMFDDLANVRGGDVKPPVTLPTGHYEAILEGPMTPHKAAKSGNVAMRFPCRITSATDDVDQESLNTVLEQNPDALSKKFNRRMLAIGSPTSRPAAGSTFRT
jgi:hypothetical protein